MSETPPRQRFGGPDVDELFGDQPFTTVGSSLLDPAIGYSIRARQAIDPETGESWTAADIMLVGEKGEEPITVRLLRLVNGDGSIDVSINADEGSIDDSRAHRIPASTAEFLNFQTEFNKGIAAIRDSGEAVEARLDAD